MVLDLKRLDFYTSLVLLFHCRHEFFCDLVCHIIDMCPSLQKDNRVTGLNINDQLVAYATRFSAVRLKNYVWSHHRALKAKVQCDFSRTYSPDHSKVLRLINIINIRYNITRHKNKKVTPFSLIGVCSILHL